MDEQAFYTLMKMAGHADSDARQKINLWLAQYLGYQIEYIPLHDQQNDHTVRLRFAYDLTAGDWSSWYLYRDESVLYPHVPHPTDKIDDAFSLLYESTVQLEDFLLYRKRGIWRASNRKTIYEAVNPALAIVGLCWQLTPKFHVAAKVR